MVVLTTQKGLSMSCPLFFAIMVITFFEFHLEKIFSFCLLEIQPINFFEKYFAFANSNDSAHLPITIIIC